MTYLEKLARAYNPAASDAITYAAQLEFLNNLEQTNPEKFQRIMGNNPSLQEGLASWRKMNAASVPVSTPAGNNIPDIPAQPSAPPPPPPPTTPPPAAAPNPAAPMPEPVPQPKSNLGNRVGGGIGLATAPLTGLMAIKNLFDRDYAQAGLNAGWTGEAALGATRAIAPQVLPSALAGSSVPAVTGTLGGSAGLVGGLSSAPVVGSWMYDIAHALDSMRKGGPEAYLQSSDDYMGENNWKTIPKAVFSPLTAGAALINRGNEVIEQNAANEAQADANRIQENRINNLEAMDREFAQQGGFKSPEEMYANMYGYNDTNAYLEALRSGEFKPEKTMGEARAMLQRGKIRPVYGALSPQQPPQVANVGSAPLPAASPAVVPMGKPVAQTDISNPAPYSGPAASTPSPAPVQPAQTTAQPNHYTGRSPEAIAEMERAQRPSMRVTPTLRPETANAAARAGAKPQPRLSPQLQTASPAPAAPKVDPNNQKQWEQRFLTETGTKYNPVSKADRASMQRMMGGNQTYNMQQWRAAGRPDAQPDFSVAYSDKPLTPNTQVAKKNAKPIAPKLGELVRRNTGITTSDGEPWINPADQTYLEKDARYKDLTWEEYKELPLSKDVSTITQFFNSTESSQ